MATTEGAAGVAGRLVLPCDRDARMTLAVGVLFMERQTTTTHLLRKRGLLGIEGHGREHTRIEDHKLPQRIVVDGLAVEHMLCLQAHVVRAAQAHKHHGGCPLRDDRHAYGGVGGGALRLQLRHEAFKASEREHCAVCAAVLEEADARGCLLLGLE